MKRISIITLLLMAVFLTACSGTLPAEFNFLPTNTSLPETATPEMTATAAATLTPLPTYTATATFTPVPTRRSPFPVTLGTPLPDPGFQRIGSGNVPLLGNVFNHLAVRRQVTLVSPNQQRVLIATTGGLFLLDREGNILSHWPELRLFDNPCQYCISVNADASRFAMFVRTNGVWEVRVYDVVDGQPNLIKSIPAPGPFGDSSDPVQVALSTGGDILAYSTSRESFAVHDLILDQPLYEFKGSIQKLKFSSNGSSLTALRGSELLLWDAADFQSPFQNLLLPNPDVPIAFSPGGEFFAVALSSKIRVYNVFPARLVREISVAPTYVTDREWQIVFTGDDVLTGYGLQWDDRSETGLITLAEWNVASGETLTLEEMESNSPNIFDSFWQIEFSETSLAGNIDLSPYRSLRFISTDVLVVNSQNAVCSFKLTTGEVNCQGEENELLHASDGPVFREVRESRNTFLVNPLGETVFQLDPYPIYWLNRTADFLLLDINGGTTDLYFKNVTRPVQSVPGAFLSAAENANLLVFLTKQKSELMFMTLVEKSSQDMLFQKRETRLFDLLTMAVDGSIYFLREDLDNNQAILKMIPPGTDEVSDLLSIDLLAEPISMAILPHNILAVGMQDGSVTIVSLDSLTQQTFQALQGPVDKIAISPDSRYLAVAGKNGITVFAVIP